MRGQAKPNRRLRGCGPSCRRRRSGGGWVVRHEAVVDCVMRTLHAMDVIVVIGGRLLRVRIGGK